MVKAPQMFKATQMVKGIQIIKGTQMVKATQMVKVSWSRPSDGRGLSAKALRWSRSLGQGPQMVKVS